MTLQYIQDNICYDLLIGSIKYYGNVDYVTEHLADGNESTLTISDRQPADLQDFVKSYKAALKVNPNLTIKEFYETYNK